MTSAEWKANQKARGLCMHCAEGKAGEEVDGQAGTQTMCGLCAEKNRIRNRVGWKKPMRVLPKTRAGRPEPLQKVERLMAVIALQAKMDTLRKSLVSAER